MVTVTGFGVMCGVKVGLAYSLCPLFTPRLSEFGPNQAIHICLTLPISHHYYSKWLDKVDIGIHCPQPYSHPRMMTILAIICKGPHVSH